jgi:N-acyl-D-aspartate/D-glutamate deacylase
MHAILRGAELIDGTGAPARRADVEIEGDRIARVGEIPQKGAADEVDLSGLTLAPGFIDIHTHFDAQVFWDPDLTPSPWHGVTTAVQGNCGFGIAPMRPEGRETIMETLMRVEGMSLDTLRAGIEWSFERFPEYMRAIGALPKRLNLATFIGHSPVRMYVLGDEAADRSASDDEVAQMQGIVREAMLAGAAGFSLSLAPSHVGAGSKPVPSRLADRREVEAMLAVVGESGRGIVELTYGPPFSIEDAAQMARDLDVRVTWGALLGGFHGPRGTAMRMLDDARAISEDIWPQVSCRYITISIHLLESMFFFAPLPAFQELLKAPRAQREAWYRSSDWRDRARQEAHSSAYEPAFHAHTWENIWVDESLLHRDKIGVQLSEIAAQRGVDPFDVMLDLALEEGLRTRFRTAVDNTDDDEVAELLNDPRTVLGAHDAGAHLDLICDAAYPSHLLGYWVREKGALPLEHAIWRMTGQPAELFRIPGRGRVMKGAYADLVAFDPASVGACHVERVRDFPAEGERLIARSQGIEHVWINGVQSRRKGEELPGVTSGVIVP